MPHDLDCVIGIMGFGSELLPACHIFGTPDEIIVGVFPDNVVVAGSQMGGVADRLDVASVLAIEVLAYGRLAEGEDGIGDTVVIEVLSFGQGADTALTA